MLNLSYLAFLSCTLFYDPSKHMSNRQQHRVFQNAEIQSLKMLSNVKKKLMLYSYKKYINRFIILQLLFYPEISKIAAFL